VEKKFLPVAKIPPNWDAIIFVISLLYFFLKVIFLATHVSPTIPPDELTHIQLGLLHHDTWQLTLPDSIDTYHLGPVSRFPTLYGWILGRLYNLNLFLLSPILFFRLLNVLLGLITVIFAWKMFRLLTSNKFVSALGIVVLTNIPMFTFLCAAISYDNLANLFAIMAFYHLFKFLNDYQCRDFWLVVIVTLAGCLTKHSFLPLGFILGAILLWDFSKSHRRILKTLWPTGCSFEKIFLTLLIGLLLFLNIRLYGINFYKFHKPIPSCHQVLTVEQCARGENFRTYHTLWEQAKKIPEDQFLKPSLYFYHWAIMIEKGILGIFGYKIIFKSFEELLLYNILLLPALFSFIRYYRFKEKTIDYCLFAIIFYAAVLFWFVNYKTYRMTAHPLAGLQGRYLFPVLAPSVFVFCYFLINNFRGIARVGLMVAVSLTFIWGDLPYFLGHVNDTWYLPKANDFSTFNAAGGTDKSSPIP